MDKKVHKRGPKNPVFSLLAPYLIPFICSFPLAVITMMAIHYFKTGKSSMHPDLIFYNPLFWCIMAGLLVIFLFLSKFRPWLKWKCSICGGPAKEELFLWTPRKFLGFRWNGYGGTPYCRKHLISEFIRAIETYEQRMVFFYPDLESKSGPYQYLYVPLADLRAQQESDTSGYTKKALCTLESALASIQGPCVECGFQANSAFFPRGSFEWGEGTQYLGYRFDQPQIDTLTSAPEILCRRCVGSKIQNSLLQWKETFIEGITGPRPAEGFYWTSEV
jgi:hypothetical protein